MLASDLLARVMRGSPFGIVLSRLEDGLILDVNEGFSRLTGYSRDEAVGATAVGLGLWVDARLRDEAMALLRDQGRLSDFEALIRTKSGDVRHFIAAMEAVDVDGVECGVVQFADLTAQRQAEAARQASEAQYRALLEQIPAVVYTESLGDTSTYTYVSPQAEAIFGFSADEILAHPGASFARIHPDDLNRVQREGERTTATGEPFRLEYRLQARDGRWVHVLDEAVLIRDASGTPLHWQGVLVDVTEQRLAEEALRRSEGRGRAIMHAALDGVIVMDQDGRITDFNQSAEETFGYRRKDVIGRSLARSIIPPEMRESHRLGLRRFLETGHGPLLGKRVEITGMRADGSSVPLELAISAVHDASGTAFVGFVRDISERIAAENALRENEERFRALVQNSYDVVIVLDRDGRRRFVSPSIERVLGYAPEELVGGSGVELVHPDDVALLQDAIDACMHGAPRTSPLELRYRHHDGSWRYFETVGTSLLDDPAVNGIVFNSRCITARKIVEGALRQSEARFRSMFEGVGSGMALVDASGTILVANPALAHMLGYDQQEMAGMTTAGISHPEVNRGQEDLRRRLWSGEIDQYQLEKRYLRKDGSVMWGLLSTTPIYDEHGAMSAALGQILDITARKATEEALRESEARFRSAFDNAPIGLALVSPDGRFQQVNRSLCDLVGYSEAELLAKTFQEITHPEDLGDDLAQVARVWAGEIDTYGMEKRYIHKDGHAVWIQLTVSVVEDIHGSRYAISQIEDISARRHLDLERATLLASEREYTRQLRELTDMRADLTAMVVHELRSPAAALNVMTEMLATGELTPEAQAETLATMRAQIDQIHRLVSDVAASAAAERNDFSVQLHPVSVAVLVEGASVFARTALASHPFSKSAAPDVQVWCDPERISQVLGNLLENAGKHTPLGTPVALAATRRGQRVRFEVTNLGSPIPPHEQTLIFEKFGRGGVAAENRTAGVGLGLYLSRRIVEAHGGELWVNSTAEHGTTFGFELRVAA